MNYFLAIFFALLVSSTNALAYERSVRDQAEWDKARAEQKARDEAQAKDAFRPWDRLNPTHAVTRPLVQPVPTPGN
jgi:hypothetical protein